MDFKQLVALSLAIVATHKLHFMRCFQPRCGLLIKWNEEKHSSNINLKLEMLPYEQVVLLKIFFDYFTNQNYDVKCTKYTDRLSTLLYLIRYISQFISRIVVPTLNIVLKITFLEITKYGTFDSFTGHSLHCLRRWLQLIYPQGYY